MDISLDHIIENAEYVTKLATALDTNKEVVKKQIFDLLITLCTYGQSGFTRAIEILEHYKKLKKERYRFKVVIAELENTLKLDYKVTLLKFVNCLIVSAGSVTNRIRIRNEYTSLGILPVFSNLRKLANNVPDICLQLKVFDDQRECDESQSLQGIDAMMNENSHLDLFYAIYRHVLETPNESRFLHILQDLSKVEPREPMRECIWSTLETIVQRTIALENESDAERMLRSASVQKISCPHCRSDIINSARKFSIPLHSTSPIALPPPPPPMILPNAPKMPPPPPPPIPNSKVPNLMNASKSAPKPPEINVETTHKSLPQQETPVPRSKMKTINWNKIPPNKVIGQNNIWSIVATNHQNTPLTEINWEEMEGLFCQQITQSSPKPSKDAANSTFELRSKKENEIALLDGKRSLNVNIFLKQFRSSNEEIIRMIRDGEHDAIGTEKLRGLLKILPEFDELEILKNFEGETHRLGHAEKFLLELLKLPNYKLRIECMLLIEEFTVNLSYLKPSINAMLYAGEDLMTSKALQEVFFLVIVAGNFLNSGGYAGNAAGVKLQSLQKITDIRANKPGMNLIHFVALQAEKRNKQLLYLADDMSNLEDASKTTIEQLNNEISALETRISAIKKQVDLPTTENDIKLQMENFIKTAENELKMLQRGLKELEATRLQLADFFCEDPQQFKIEECYKIFYQFCEKFRQAVKENEKRKLLEEQANMRRKQREEQLANKRRQFRQYETPTSTTLDNSFLMDPPSILYDIRFSPAMNRRRISPNINTGDNRDDLVSPSPDITPNGSLRRRRSKVLSEEDEGGLMDFLRNSGHDSMSRERKSLSDYGSLDRSWAKRKQRPDLLNVDFNLDRERPASPIDARALGAQQQNAAESNGNDQKPRISREWRLKIENWLQANEQDDKLNEDYKRRMKRMSNRRTLDNDAESEKLDTLVEEKEKHHLSPKSPVAIQPPVKLDVCDAVVSSGSVKVQHFSNSGKQIISPAVETSTKESDKCEKEEEEKKKQQQQQSQRQLFTTRLNDPRDSNLITYSKAEHKHDNNTSSKQSHLSETNNKIEIDSDNIETPPTVRRNINVLKLLKGQNQKADSGGGGVAGSGGGGAHDEKTIEPENLGDGQFNRYASARRTRRYKRPVDLNHSTEENAIIKSSSAPHVDDSILCSGEKNTLPMQTESGHNPHNPSLLNRNNSIDRSIRKIHREGARLGAMKSSSPEEEGGGGIKRYSGPGAHIRSIHTNKITSHELNDEGFEETQSLVSDTPSLTTSSCNDEGNKLTAVKQETPSAISTAKSSATSSSSSTATPATKRPLIKASNQLQTLLTRNQQSLERSRSLRNTTSSFGGGSGARNGAASSLTPTAAPRRVNSMKKMEKPEAPKNALPNKHLFVKRSNSRTSLISSISSLNSAVSTNTVKRMPTKLATASSSASTASGVRKPVITISNNHSATPRTSAISSTRIPASRSSSSGSSIGPKPTVSKSLSASTTSSLKSRESVVVGRNSSKLFHPNPSARSSSFMRPTTASASKSK